MTINKNTIISNWGVTQKPVLLLEQFMTYIARQIIQTKIQRKKYSRIVSILEIEHKLGKHLKRCLG